MAVRPSMTFRLSPADKEKLEQRAESEGRTIGETVSLLIRENELAFSSRRGQDKGEAKKA